MDSQEPEENGLDTVEPDAVEDGGADDIQCLISRVKQLEDEKVKIQEEFGHQRAKMKELFVQKEAECKRETEECSRLMTEVRRLEVELGEAQSQLLAVGFQQESDLVAEKQKCLDENASLQQLIQETVEESSSSRSKYENEIRQLRVVNERLDGELQILRQRQLEKLGAGPGSDAGVTGVLNPSMLSAVTKSLARKVVSLAPSSSASIIPSAASLTPRAPSPTPSESSPENLEDSMRKAKEDAEVLRSVVIPLEEEISALKDKLRATDEQLQWYHANCQDVPPSQKSSLFTEPYSHTQDFELFKPATGSENQLMGMSIISLASQSDGPGRNSSPRSSPLIFATSQSEDARSLSGLSVEEKSGPVPPMSPGPRGTTRCMTPVPVVGCDMCSNYEAQLQKVQQTVGELQQQNKLLQRAADRYREDLAKETEFRKEMEEKWGEKKEEHKNHVERLSKKVDHAEELLQCLQRDYKETAGNLTKQLALLTKEREDVHKRLQHLQSDNERLVGKHSTKAAVLQDESINLPSAVEELQELLLQTREDLIFAKVGKETAEEEASNLQSELQLFQDEMGSQLQASNLENKQLRKQVTDHKNLVLAERALQLTVAELKKELAELKRSKAHLEKTELELRNRVASLQLDLDNNEATQQDFVQLSQSLQMELERLREAEKEVRWQHEDDVDECPGCRAAFSVTKRKKNCRHCGRVFCVGCLPHQVASGPKQRMNRVCDVCHTLLVRESAPYFSTKLPHTPD